MKWKREQRPIGLNRAVSEYRSWILESDNGEQLGTVFQGSGGLKVMLYSRGKMDEGHRNIIFSKVWSLEEEKAAKEFLKKRSDEVFRSDIELPWLTAEIRERLNWAQSAK